MIPPFLPGERLGIYKLEDFFHIGNMALIYTVKEAPILVKAPYIGLAPRFYRQFRNEIIALSLLDHPGIIKVLEKKMGKKPWFSMERLKGECLCQQLKQQHQFESRKATQIAFEIAQTIAYAHRKSPPVWHCDLKPSHVFFQQTQLFILDFGLARFERSTTGDCIQGSLAYMAPEQFRGLADARSDVYALGAILYHMLCGTPPFPKQDGEESETAIIERILNMNLPVLMPNNVKPPLSIICKKALDKRADLRYANAGEMAQALAKLAPRRPTLLN